MVVVLKVMTLLKWMMMAMLMGSGVGGVVQELRGSKQICGGGGDGLVVVELGHVGVEQSQLEVELGLLWGRQAAVVVLHLVR
jgi:hypothetical protein